MSSNLEKTSIKKLLRQQEQQQQQQQQLKAQLRTPQLGQSGDLDYSKFKSATVAGMFINPFDSTGRKRLLNLSLFE